MRNAMFYNQMWFHILLKNTNSYELKFIEPIEDFKYFVEKISSRFIT